MEIKQAYDLVVVGGGIGGPALAQVMARQGKSVLLLEKTTVYEDHVRGEWIAPWGVVEVKRVGIYDLLMQAGGHHLSKHITYDETLPPEMAQQAALPLDQVIPGIPGPLCIGHPHHCQTLFDAALEAGVTGLRGVNVKEVVPGSAPTVTFTMGDEEHTVSARLVVGADGRASMVRKAAGIDLQQDKPHHMFAGLLVEDVKNWDEHTQAIGTEGEFAFLAFPQGNGKVRVYGSYSLDQRARFSGEEGTKAFLEAFRMNCAPENQHIADGKPAGPLRAYFNSDAWTEEPMAEGVVLVGDAAGWNDPINGLGLSITYRDVRMVTEILAENENWTPEIFKPYAEERFERMRRLRFVGHLQAGLDAEFGPEAREKRANYFARSAQEADLGVHGFAVLAGPEALGPEYFTPEHKSRVLGR